jgi:hypothetical protein
MFNISTKLSKDIDIDFDLKKIDLFQTLFVEFDSVIIED